MRQIRNFLPTVICALTFLVAAPNAQAQNELKCRGAKGAFVFDRVKPNTLALSFVASSRAAGATGQDLEPGTCAWTDRILNDSDSRQIQFAVSASDAVSIPNYLDDPAHYWTFLVTTTNKDHFESKGHSGVTNAEAVARREPNDSASGNRKPSSGGLPGASLGGIPGASLGGIPSVPGGIPGASVAGGIPGASAVGGIPAASVGGVPTPSAGGIVYAQPDGLAGLRIPGSFGARFKGRLRRLALDTARVSQINNLIRGGAKPGEPAADTADLPVITEVAAAFAEQSVIFSFTTKPSNSLPLVELAATLPVLGPDKRLAFQVGPGLVVHPAEGDTATGQFWVDMNQKLEPGKFYYYIISAWKNNNPNAPRRQVLGSFLMPAPEPEQPSAIPPQ